MTGVLVGYVGGDIHSHSDGHSDRDIRIYTHIGTGIDIRICIHIRNHSVCTDNRICGNNQACSNNYTYDTPDDTHSMDTQQLLRQD